MRVGAWLRMEKRSAIKINELAEALGVDRRTLLNWKKQNNSERKIGRPAYPPDQKFRTLLQVGREWKRQECCGWRGVKNQLGNQVPTRLIQQHIATLKLQQRKKIRKRIESQRVTVTVKTKNVFWSMDGTKHFGQPHQGIKDRASKKIILIDAVPRDNGSTVIQKLKKMEKERGLPLVLGTDNGSMNVCSKVKRYLRKKMVIHLKSLPRTPQHNAAIEAAFQEIKAVALQNGCSLSEAASRINKNRLRPSFGFKSSEEIDDKMTVVYDEGDRKKFYDYCCERLKNARAGTKNRREARMLERKVILEALRTFGFVEINRGPLV